VENSQGTQVLLQLVAPVAVQPLAVQLAAAVLFEGSMQG
jgi:hypothetical protein